MATDKKTLVTAGIIGGIAILLGIVYAIYKSMNKIKTSNSSNVANQNIAKNAGYAKKQLASNPSDVVLQEAYSAAANKFAEYLTSRSSNKDGSTPDKVTSKNGSDAIIVDKDGNYIETGDPSTLYYADGSIKANLDPNSGMFVDGNGTVVASSDGSPCHVDEYGNYTEADGSTYAPDGTPIILNGDGTYTEESSGDVFNMDGTTSSNSSVDSEGRLSAPHKRKLMAIGGVNKGAKIHKLFK